MATASRTLGIYCFGGESLSLWHSTSFGPTEKTFGAYLLSTASCVCAASCQLGPGDSCTVTTPKETGKGCSGSHASTTSRALVAKRKCDQYSSEKSDWLKIRNPHYSQWVGRRELFERERETEPSSGTGPVAFGLVRASGRFCGSRPMCPVLDGVSRYRTIWHLPFVR